MLVHVHVHVPVYVQLPVYVYVLALMHVLALVHVLVLVHVHVLTCFRYLVDEAADKIQTVLASDEWDITSVLADVPKQANSDDCGVFVCMFADLLSTGRVSVLSNWLMRPLGNNTSSRSQCCQ